MFKENRKLEMAMLFHLQILEMHGLIPTFPQMCLEAMRQLSVCRQNHRDMKDEPKG